MSMATLEERNRRLRLLAKRWRRSAWDYRGMARWQSFDESFWTSALAVGLLIVTGYFDLSVWWGLSPPPLFLIGELGGTPGENVLLVLLLLTNVWVFDRLLAAKVPAGLSEASWLRWARGAAVAIPLAGLAVIPFWQWLVRNRPSWAFSSRPEGPPLRLEGRLPARFGIASGWMRIDARLRSWSQYLLPKAVWLVACQLTPLFSGLSLIQGHGPGTARTVNILLHLAGAALAWAHTILRSRDLQMTGRRARFFRLLPLALLLPVPFSLVPALTWFLGSEPEREDKGVVQALYSYRAPRRLPFAPVRGPRMGEIAGRREASRMWASGIKVALLGLESAVLAWIAASFGSPLLPLETYGGLWMSLVALATLPGLFLFFAGAVSRTSRRWPRFNFLADHPYAAFLFFVPLALMLGLLAGTLAGSNGGQSGQRLHLLLALFGLGGILTTLLVLIWDFLLALSFGVPDRPLTGKAICVSVSGALLLLALLPIETFFGSLCAGIAILSLLGGLAVASRGLAPFRFRDLEDPRVPARLRGWLWFLTLTAVLPLGGLAVPVWIRMRHLHRPALDLQAARLRKPAA